MLRICVAERNVTTGRIIWSECEQDVFTPAVVNARGLEQKPIRRIEQLWEIFNGMKVTREADVCKSNRDDERRDQQGKDHPQAEERVT